MIFRTKLLLAQAPLGIVLALVCALSVVMVSSLGTHSQTILTDNYRSVLAAQRMKESLERLDSAALFLLAGQPDKGRRQTATYEPLFETELQVQEGNVTELGEKEATERLRAAWADYQQKFAHLQTLADPEAAKQWYFTELEPAFYAVKTTADSLLALNQDAMVRKSAEVRRAAERMNTLIIAAAMGAFALGLFFSIILTNRLLRPLAVLSQATRRLGAGDFATRAHLHGHDEFAQLAKDFNAMADHLHAYRNSSLGELLQSQQAAQAAIDSLPDPVVMFGVAGDVRNVNRVAAAERGVQLSTQLSFAEEEVLADPERIGLVFSNLLTNALRYTPQGGAIAVRARPIEGAVRFEVADTGTGIPQEYQEHVFDKFFRIPGSASNGVGLGLSIVKEIVHGHAGEVGLESQAGHGSTFWFTLPRTSAHEERRT